MSSSAAAAGGISGDGVADWRGEEKGPVPDTAAGSAFGDVARAATGADGVVREATSGEDDVCVSEVDGCFSEGLVGGGAMAIQAMRREDKNCRPCCWGKYGVFAESVHYLI